MGSLSYTKNSPSGLKREQWFQTNLSATLFCLCWVLEQIVRDRKVLHGCIRWSPWFKPPIEAKVVKPKNHPHVLEVAFNHRYSEHVKLLQKVKETLTISAYELRKAQFLIGKKKGKSDGYKVST